MGDSVDWSWTGGNIVYDTDIYGPVTMEIKYSDEYAAPKVSFSMRDSDVTEVELNALMEAYFPGYKLLVADKAAAAYGSIDTDPTMFAECILSFILFGTLEY